MPSTGIITSAITNVAGGTSVFDLGYNGSAINLTSNNTLRFSIGGAGGASSPLALTLATPSQVTTLDFLAAAGSNGSTFDVTLNFVGGTSDTYTTAITTGPLTQFDGNDTKPTNAAFSGTSEGTYNNPVQNGTNNWMTESDITLTPADQLKTISSITFNPTSFGQAGANADASAIYAVSGTVVSAPVTLTSQTYANNVSVTANSSIDVSGSLTAAMGTLSIGSNKLSVTGADATTSAYSLTFGATNLSGSATFGVANSGGGGAGTLNLGALNDGGSPSSINIASTGLGSVSLSSPATSLVTGTEVNVTGGTLNSANTTALGTTATVNMASPGVFNVVASQQISALNGSAGTVNLPGSALTVGSTDNLNSSFGGVISGSGGIITEGTGTLTLSGGSNTYSGVVDTINGQAIQASVQLFNGTVVAAAPTTVTGGAIAAGPLGTGVILFTPASATPKLTAQLLLANTPGLSLPNAITAGSAGDGIDVVGGLNTSGVTTFTGVITLGSGNSGDNGHAATLAASNGGEVDFTNNIVANQGSTNTRVSIVNLSGTGSATVKVFGNNSYAGGTVVMPNVTYAAGLSTSTTQLGISTVTLSGGNLALQGQQAHGSQGTISVSGFQTSLIVPASATSAASATNSTIDGQSVLYQAGFALPMGLRDIPRG